MSGARERLRAAYEATTYRVDAGPRRSFAIRVGLPSAEADALLAAAGAGEWAFITAANPRSVRVSDDDNAARLARLGHLVRERGLASVTGAGVADDGAWPAEASLFVLGIGAAEAVAIARAFDQHAILVGRRGGPARLVWVDGGDPAS